MYRADNVLGCPPPILDEEPIKFKPSKTITGNALREFASLPYLGICALNPQHSFFIIGLQMFFEQPDGGYLSGFNNSMGFLLMASSPVVAIFKGVFAVGSIATGVAGTTVLGPSYAVEKGIRKVIHSDKLNNPSLKRKALINAFVKRMSKLINVIAQGEESRRYLIENPMEISVLSAISLAFNSKKEYGSNLVMADGKKLTKDDIEVLDPLFITYFDGICDIRNNLRNISYSQSKETWNEFINTMNKLCLGEVIVLDNVQRKNYHNVYIKSHEIASSICNDPDFIEIWNEQYPRQ